MKFTVLLTATVVPQDVVYCDRKDVDLRLQDYLRAFQFWLGEPLVENIVFVENSGFDLAPFQRLLDRRVTQDKRVELLGFTQPAFDRNLGKSYGEARIIRHALDHSKLLAGDAFVLKGTGRYVPINFFKVWPDVMAMEVPAVMSNFQHEPDVCDSRFFGANRQFLDKYLWPACQDICDSEGFYFEHALARAVNHARRDDLTWSPFPRGGFMVDGVQGSTNTAFPYPYWKRMAYRAIASYRNGTPLRWSLGAPVWRQGQGSRT